MQILDELYAETRRLFIAGSKFAKGDPRVIKYIPTLTKMGEKVPVMKKLAEKYTELTKEGKPEALADAGTFLYAVMATQGSTEISGKTIDVVPSIDVLPKTSTPYSRIKPVIDALTLSMQGRYEVIKNAFEEGLLNDFRIYGHIAAALDDKYSAVADYIYSFVIPSIGPVLIPYLLEKYDTKGKHADAMRIALLDELGYEDAELLAFKAIEEGSIPVAAGGVKILGKNPENEKYLLTLANDKRAEIREAALIGLINMDSGSGKEFMLKLLQGSKYKSAIPAAQLCTDNEYANKLLNLIKPYYEDLYAEGLNDDEFKKANNKFTELLAFLENKHEPEIYKFYVQLLTDKKYSKRVKEYKSPSYLLSDMQLNVCQQLGRSPNEKIVMVCEEAISLQIAKKAPYIIKHYYNAAKNTYTTERIYSVFSKYYESNVVSFTDLFCPRGIYLDYFNDKESMENEFKNIRINVDIHWKKLFIKNEDIDAIRVLICEGDECEKEMKEVILRKVKKSADNKKADLSLGLAIGRLVEMSKVENNELEKIAEACYKVFENADRYHIQYFYEGIGTDNFKKLFNNSYNEKFIELSKKKTSTVFKRIEELLS